jgi:glycosyl transferase family 4
MLLSKILLKSPGILCSCYHFQRIRRAVLRICLLNGSRNIDGDALQSAGATTKLAYELAAEGHSVQVIFTDASLLSDQNSVGTDQRIRYHLVDPGRFDFTGRFMNASPEAHKALQQSLQHWQKLMELHTQEPFDLFDAGTAVLSALMPSMCRAIPTVCAVHDKMAIFQERKLPFAGLGFDTELTAMLERLTLNLVERISVPSASLEERMPAKLNAISNKFDLPPALASTSAKIQQYKKASEQARLSTKVYLKGPADLTVDTLMIFKAYDEMIYNFLYQNSYRFRIYHWWQMLRSNPGLFQSKLKQALRVGQ